MKTLVLYATKHGSTRDIAEMIAERLPGSTVCDLKSSVPPLSGYDCVALGGPLMAGQIHSDVREFANNNSSALQKMRLGLFITGMDGSQESKYLETNFPEELLKAAKSKRYLGGVYDPSKCGFIERMVMKAAAKLSAYTSKAEPALIDLFVKELSE